MIGTEVSYKFSKLCNNSPSTLYVNFLDINLNHTEEHQEEFNRLDWDNAVISLVTDE